MRVEVLHGEIFYKNWMKFRSARFYRDLLSLTCKKGTALSVGLLVNGNIVNEIMTGIHKYGVSYHFVDGILCILK